MEYDKLDTYAKRVNFLPLEQRMALYLALVHSGQITTDMGQVEAITTYLQHQQLMLAAMNAKDD